MESKKFRFYITDLFEGVITGTDDEAMARKLALSEEASIERRLLCR
jgi:hypothetical protein